jgi:hypothetical protein
MRTSVGMEKLASTMPLWTAGSFKGVAPRVDKNTEARGPWWWLKATRHGHFYVQVQKKAGAVIRWANGLSLGSPEHS